MLNFCLLNLCFTKSKLYKKRIFSLRSWYLWKSKFINSNTLWVRNSLKKLPKYFKFTDPPGSRLGTAGARIASSKYDVSLSNSNSFPSASSSASKSASSNLKN